MPASSPKTMVAALAAGPGGEVFDLPGYFACGAAGDLLRPLEKADVLPLPHGSEILFLPDRSPVVWDPDAGGPVALAENPFAPGEPLFAVAVFNSPGYVAAYHGAWEERKGANTLPLFSYGAAGFLSGGVVSAAFLVDAEPRQDLRRMPMEKVRAGVRRMRKKYPRNRLVRHLAENCALTYGCPAAKNFFLGRYEAPLPASPACNARCLGCLSLQEEGALPVSQERVAFVPEPEEIAQVACEHIRRVGEKAVVSFGQGCEGDPLLVADTVAESARLIRETTDRGTINVNTNAGRPDLLEKVLSAGVDAVRVSMNSVRPACYAAYFRPRYAFADVLESIDLAGKLGRWVSVNYLNLAGFTDSAQESAALFDFLKNHPVDMIQWRNLNYDPPRYHRRMAGAAESTAPMGMAALVREVKRRFPRLSHGYFNPPARALALRVDFP
ncbi:MAG: radical SAM protein [Deltaproteobacteria bacterium]|nr:radical SAM protein [Deltaproteobacteria bacterium]